jgi:dihydropteroate synthase
MVKIVGILNITPDSFSDGGKFNAPEKALSRADELFAQGADLIDVGAESTRPNATPVSPDEEWARLAAILPPLMAKYNGRLSLDTYHPETAAKALDLGEIIINDVSGMSEAMMKLVADQGVTCIVGHIAAGKSLSNVHEGEMLDDIQVVIDDLLAKASQLESMGLSREKIILDPCIGFGKTQKLNELLLEFAKYVPDYAVMIGYSRKRFLGDNRMDVAVNLEAAAKAVAAGAKYLRVHDVAEHAAQFSGK